MSIEAFVVKIIHVLQASKWNERTIKFIGKDKCKIGNKLTLQMNINHDTILELCQRLAEHAECPAFRISNGIHIMGVLKHHQGGKRFLAMIH